MSSLLLWKAVPPAPLEALARRERLWNLVLLIEGLSLALVCAALARPFVMRETTRPVHLVLGIDDSASIGAGDRWTRAQARARELVGGLESDDVVTLLTNQGEKPRIAPKAALAEIGRLWPAAMEDDLDGLLARARSLAGAEEGAVARVLTDRAVADAPEVESFGGPVDNAGIIDASYDGKEVFALVAATSPRRVSLKIPGAKVPGPDVDVAPDRPAAVLFPLDPYEALGADESFVIQIQSVDGGAPMKDDLAADNECKLVETPRIRVRLETPGNPELVRALSVQPGVDLVHGDSREADLVVLDRTWPAEWPRAPLVIIAPPDGCPYRGKAVKGPITTWDANHPLLEGLDPNAVGFTRGISMDTEGIIRDQGEPWAPIATVDGQPLMAVHLGMDDMILGLYVGFDVSLASGQSTWATHPHFPIFWNRVVGWVAHGGRATWTRSGLLSRKETLCAGLSTPVRPVDFRRTRVVSSPRFVAAHALAAAALGFSLAFLLARKANGWRSSSSSTTR